MFKQVEAHGQPLPHTDYANGYKLYRNTGSEAYWTELCFKNANRAGEGQKRLYSPRHQQTHSY